MLLIEWFSFVFGKFLEIPKCFIIRNTILKYIFLLNLYKKKYMENPLNIDNFSLCFCVSYSIMKLKVQKFKKNG